MKWVLLFYLILSSRQFYDEDIDCLAVEDECSFDSSKVFQDDSVKKKEDYYWWYAYNPAEEKE